MEIFYGNIIKLYDKFKEVGKDVIFIANIPASAEDENNYKFEQYGDTFLKL